MSKAYINIVAIKLTVALLIAFVIYYFFPSNTDYWSLVTIMAIVQADFDNTLNKAIMRLLGTLIGAIIGFGLALLINQNEILILILFFISIFFTSLIALQRTNYTYAGVVAGITLVIVLSASLLSGQLVEMALERTVQVIIGIFILLAINIIILVFFETKVFSIQYFIGELRHLIPSHQFILDRNIIKAALKITIACTFTFLTWLLVNQPEGFWATVSCLLIMEESIKATKVKASFRIIAHLLAASVGVLWAISLGNYLWSLIIPIIMGGYFCGYLISLKNKYSPLGTTMGIALMIMLLMSPGSVSTLDVTFARFLNVMFGVIVAILASHYLFRTSVTKE